MHEHENGFTLTWKSLNVIVSEKMSRKLILQNINGIAKPGQMLAIMGASGAGKSTLLNVLNFRNINGLEVSGMIKVNGHQVNSVDEMASISGYVQQDALFFVDLTVKEHMKFQAMLKMDKSLSYKERMTRVEEILNDLDLEKCENTLIKGLSGGEKRRLAFASEVITDPPLLFCDEPTSGLDSSMTESLVDCMKRLAQQGGKTIICTIHQPSSEVFHLFDTLCLLAEGGQSAYFGDLLNAKKFFETPPLNYNHAEFYLDQLTVSQVNLNKCRHKIQRICNGFEQSDEKKQLEKEIEIQETNRLNRLSTNKNKKTYNTNSFTQFRWLLWRQSRLTARDAVATRIHIISIMCQALLVGIVYFQQKLNQDSMQNMAAVFALSTCNISFSYTSIVVHSFVSELPIFLHEHHSGLYRVINYYLSKTIIELPLNLLICSIFSIIIYTMVNINANLIILIAAVVLVTNVGIALGTFISVASPSINVALLLISPLNTPAAIVAGLFINFDNVSKYFYWLKYTSHFAYTNEILNINQWDGVEGISCSNSSIVCLRTGDEVIRDRRMNKDNYNLDFILLVVLYISWRVLSFLILLARSYRKN